MSSGGFRKARRIGLRQQPNANPSANVEHLYYEGA
jgi:hypothetical protein